MAIGVARLTPADSRVVAALLGHCVGCDALRSAGLPHAQRRPIQAVCVGLDGAEAVEAQVIDLRRESPLYAEAGHRREALRARVGCGQADRTVAAQLVADRNDHLIHSRELVLVGYDNVAVTFFDAGGHAARVGARRCPARAIESVTAPPVVVRKRTEGG